MQKALIMQNPWRITQGENGSTSHAGSLALDLGGEYTAGSGSIDKSYAPWDGKVVRADGSSNGAMYIESLEKVLAPDGSQQIQRFVLIHTNSYVLKDGDTFKQGDHIYTEGTNGGVRAHTHIEGGYGTWDSVGGAKLSKNSSGTWSIANQASIYDMLFVPTVYKVTASGGYKWVYTTDADIKENDDMKLRAYVYVDETARTSELIDKGYERAIEINQDSTRKLLKVVKSSEVDETNISTVIENWEKDGIFKNGGFVVPAKD